MSVSLHTPKTIYSGHHLGSWVLLAFAAGSVNAGGLLAAERFVSHVTGTATQLGTSRGHWILILDLWLILAAFILGAVASVFFLGRRQQRGDEPRYALPLAVVSLLLAGVALAGHLGAFGPFGSSLDAAPDLAMLALLAFAMGLQNATVATGTGLAVRTTHMTGPATDLGVHLGTMLSARGEERADARRGAVLRGGKLVGFVLGGALTLPLAQAAGYLAFLVPAGAVLVAARRSFLPGWSLGVPHRLAHAAR